MTTKLDNSLTISIVSYYAEVDELSTVVASLIVALKNLRENTEDSFAIFIIDNSESNELSLANFAHLQDRLSIIGCELRIVQGQGNVGYGAGQNLALTNMSNSYHLFMNADIEVDTNSLISGVNFLATNPEVAAVSPSATYEDGSKQYLCKRFPSVLDFFLRGFTPRFVQNLFSSRLARFEMQELSESEPSDNIPIISGCFMLCRSSALLRVAGFNDDYFLYFEDFDLSMRLNEHYSLAYVPSMKIKHHGGNSARKGLKHIGYFVRSGTHFFNTYGWRWF